MTALRWILLLAGLAFLGMLTCWELWRARRSQASASTLLDGIGPESAPPATGARHAHAPAPAPLDPPLLESVAASDAVEEQTVDLSAPREPPAAETPADADASMGAPAPSQPAAKPDQGAAHSGLSPDCGPAAPQPGPSAPGAAGESREAPPGGPLQSPPLFVEWPPEGERYILSVRLVADRPEGLSGRALRQALEFCAFQHGRFGIFHQPGLDGRALISAAGLSKPGIFDPLNMDFQRFSGLSLFTVLPGPLPCGAALDHLLHTARELAQRVQGRLQDEQGAALDADSIERLKRRLEQLPDGPRQEESAA